MVIHNCILTFNKKGKSPGMRYGFKMNRERVKKKLKVEIKNLL